MVGTSSAAGASAMPAENAAMVESDVERNGEWKRRMGMTSWPGFRCSGQRRRDVGAGPPVIRSDASIRRGGKSDAALIRAVALGPFDLDQAAVMHLHHHLAVTHLAQEAEEFSLLWCDGDCRCGSGFRHGGGRVRMAQIIPYSHLSNRNYEAWGCFLIRSKKSSILAVARRFRATGISEGGAGHHLDRRVVH